MKIKPKQIAAWICIIALLALSVATFIIGLSDFPGSDALFFACLTAMVFLPILLWIYIWLYGKIRDKHTIASMDLFQANQADQRNEHKNEHGDEHRNYHNKDEGKRQ